MTEKRKKAYRKPEIKRVRLMPEEAVLGGCKTTGGPGEYASSCTAPSNCFTEGS